MNVKDWPLLTAQCRLLLGHPTPYVVCASTRQWEGGCETGLRLAMGEKCIDHVLVGIDYAEPCPRDVTETIAGHLVAQVHA